MNQMFLRIMMNTGADITPPAVPESGERYMPPDTESFSEGLWYVIKTAIYDLNPSISQAAGICLSLVAIVLLVSVMRSMTSKTQPVVTLCAAVGISVLLLGATKSLIHLSVQTVIDLSNYGKLLLPVMTSGLAAQGAVSSSAALYAGSTVFCTVLTSLITKIVVPLIYVFICLSVALSAIGDESLKSIRDFAKWIISWSMKIVLYVFSGYISITKVVTGSVDASALKVTKLAVSGMIPVVGKIISDSSETILVSAGIVKNGVGIYGLLAIISVLIGPFLKIGVQYLLFKITAAICSLFGIKSISVLIDDFSKAMAMTLGMIGILGLLLMISTVCFMKGVA